MTTRTANRLFVLYILALWGIGLYAATFKEDLAERIEGGALVVLSILYLIEFLRKGHRR